MRLEWNKLGRIFTASGQFGWINSHAQVPTALVLGDRIRIYFATRPTSGFSLTTYIDVDIDDPLRVININDKPILEAGAVGMFDEFGIMPSHAIRRNDEIWLYYGGWSRQINTPYSNWTGLAVSHDNGVTFEKAFKGPILDRTPNEVYSATAPCLFQHDGLFHMWYASGIAWHEVGGGLEEEYTIMHATSTDGLCWKREGVPILENDKFLIEPKHRPAVFVHDGVFHMLFCYRSVSDFRDGLNSYRLGLAKSEDLKHWTRSDGDAGLLCSSEGWDSKMIAYPYIVNARGRTLMFYNGNGFGAEGFGVAELKK